MGLKPELSADLNLLRRAVLLRLARSRGLVVDKAQIAAWIENHGDRDVWRRIERFNRGLRGAIRRALSRWIRQRP